MKYECLVFDYINTLGKPLDIPKEIQNLPKLLYQRGYRLAVIHFTKRYSDALWLRKKLDFHAVLPYFELVVCSSVVGNKYIFKRTLELMDVNPRKTLFIGTKERNCKLLGCDFLEGVENLFATLKDKTHNKRKLSHIKEFIEKDGYICPKISSLSTEITKGDHIIIKGIEYKITEELPIKITKDKILKEEARIPLKVERV